MRLIALLFIAAMIFLPAQQGTSVNVLTGMGISDTEVVVGHTVQLYVFVNVTVLFNDTAAEYRNGTISVNVTVKIPTGLNVTDLSNGEYRNGSVVSYRDNTTYALLYITLNATQEGDYTLSAVVNVTTSIFARSGNETPSYYNGTMVKTTNFVHLKVVTPQQEEERNRLSLYDSLRSRVLQIILVLMLAGFLISNAVSDYKARRKRS